MPIYFAYGANMDIEAMRVRCPASRALGPARLMGHRFFIMPEGYASVRRQPGAAVHGLLWDLALADVPALDRFEEVGSGLYTKVTQPVLKAVGSTRALIYIGRTLDDGHPRPGYLEGVLASAQALGLPSAYCRSLGALLPATKKNGGSGEGGDMAPRPVSGVTPRFATPFDRK